MTRLRTERRLARALFGRFFESELMPAGLTQVQVVIWSVALFAAPGYLLSLVFAMKYGGVPRERLVQATQADRLFFVTFAMMAVGTVALFTWESLFPDRRDARILGTLPMRTRTHVLARILAVAGVAGLFCIGVNLPPAVFYGLTLWGNDVAAGPLRAVVAHFVATTMGGLFMFFAFMAAQGVLLNLFGRRLARQCAIVLQAVFVFGLLQSLLFVPALADLVRTAFASDGAGVGGFLPPAWFLALYDVVAGTPRAAPVRYALTALIATPAAAAGAIALLAGSYARLVRMAIETPGENATSGPRRILRAGVFVSILIGRHPVERAVAGFTLRTLTRSRSHQVLLATYIGIAAAVALPALIRAASSGGISAFGDPTGAVLSVPLVVNFFVLCGARVLIAIPTDIRANWIFRLNARADRMVPAISGVRRALVLMFVTPIAITAAASGAALWDLRTALSHGLFTGLLGLLLVELLLVGLRKIPFTCTYSPGSARVRTLWPVYAIGFSVYAYALSSVELAILSHSLLFALAIVVIAGVSVVVSSVRGRDLRHPPGFTYEEHDSDEVFQGFGLSEGLAAGHRTSGAIQPDRGE